MSIFILATISILAMLGLALPRAGKYGISISRAVILTFFVLTTGIFGTMVMFYIENGIWGGTSFFGAVFFIPYSLYVLSRYFDLDFNVMTDLMAPPGLGMFAVNKLNCLASGCCDGKLLGYSNAGVPQYFPSQIVELFSALIIVAIALVLEKTRWFRGRIYPICMVCYGVFRYILNSFRMEQSIFIFGMSPGSVWALCAIASGMIWIMISYSNSKTEV